MLSAGNTGGARRTAAPRMIQACHPPPRGSTDYLEVTSDTWAVDMNPGTEPPTDGFHEHVWESLQRRGVQFLTGCCSAALRTPQSGSSAAPFPPLHVTRHLSDRASQCVGADPKNRQMLEREAAVFGDAKTLAQFVLARMGAIRVVEAGFNAANEQCKVSVEIPADSGRWLFLVLGMDGGVKTSHFHSFQKRPRRTLPPRVHDVAWVLVTPPGQAPATWKPAQH